MKQFQMMYEKDRGFQAWLARIRNYCQRNDIRESSIVFHIYSDTVDQERVVHILRILKEAFPSAVYAGTTSSGNIIRGGLAGTHISLTCTVFSCPYTKLEALQFPMTADSQDEVAAKVVEAVRQRPWVSAVEMMTTLRGLDTAALCLSFYGLPKDVAFYGGGAMAVDVENNDTSPTFVFSSAGEPSPFSAVFLLMGGPHLQVKTWHLTGWRRLGLPLEATAFKGNRLCSLNGRPAADVYLDLLSPPRDDRFIRLANVFPLSFELNGTEYLRTVAEVSDEDGSLRLSASIRTPGERAGRPDGFSPIRCSIAFGDPADILKRLEGQLREVYEFSPQVIRLFSCLARKYFWGAQEVSRETFPFETIAPTSGYYTAGEFLRTKDDILMHNTTIVIAAMRESKAAGEGNPSDRDFHVASDDLSTQLLVGSCLASFIDAQTREFGSHPIPPAAR